MPTLPKVLIVDDDPFFIEFYRAELTQYGFDVDYAKNGEDGVEKAKTVHPDIILLDVILPKMDGFAVLEALKSNDSTKDIPVIIISALGLSSDVDRLIKLGAIKHFKKLNVLPKDIAEYLKTLVEDIASKKKQALPKEVAKPSVSGNQEKVALILKDGLSDLGVSLTKFFGKQVLLGDVSVSTIPFDRFQTEVGDTSENSGSLFVYSIITGTREYGLSLLSLNKSDTEALIQLVERGLSGKSLGMGMADQVVEEFFNIIANAALGRLFSSVEDAVVLPPPTIVGGKEVEKIITQFKEKNQKEEMVIFVEQSYSVGESGLNFSFFVSLAADSFKYLV